MDKTPYYHGSSEENIKDIVNKGIDFSKTQSRDYGFFGKGFYVTSSKDIAMQHATTTGPNNPAIAEIKIKNNANILYAGETFGKGSVKPQSPPSWHSDYLNFQLKSIKDAAVWEYDSIDKTKEEILDSARKSRTPSSSQFERKKWYKEVTEYAKSKNYDIIYWTKGEIIILSKNSIKNIKFVD